MYTPRMPLRSAVNHTTSPNDDGLRLRGAQPEETNHHRPAICQLATHRTHYVGQQYTPFAWTALAATDMHMSVIRALRCTAWDIGTAQPLRRRSMLFMSGGKSVSDVLERCGECVTACVAP